MPRRGPSPRCLKRICFTFRTMSVTSSCTPGMEANSCRTRSSCTRMAVTATPCSDESSTRRSALPSVVPKPRSSGSTMKRRVASVRHRLVGRRPAPASGGLSTSFFDPPPDPRPGHPSDSGADRRPVRARYRRLLRVELDDQLLLERHRDLLPRRNPQRAVPVIAFSSNSSHSCISVRRRLATVSLTSGSSRLLARDRDRRRPAGTEARDVDLAAVDLDCPCRTSCRAAARDGAMPSR